MVNANYCSENAYVHSGCKNDRLEIGFPALLEITKVREQIIAKVQNGISTSREHNMRFFTREAKNGLKMAFRSKRLTSQPNCRQNPKLCMTCNGPYNANPKTAIVYCESKKTSI